ncbi:MAG TPA: marine proteobacterial sortase target protein [Woeseiaceae bacterium]|nr:marine proteobacterial sortase target protein [Woeseiaceae bacterium]
MKTPVFFLARPAAGALPRTWRRQALRLLPVLLSLPLAAVAGLAQDEIGRQQSGNLLLRMQQGYRVATRLNTDIDMAVSGMIARVRVSQSFRNDGPNWVEGVYVFPLPAGAAVDRLRLTAGERIVEGEIRAREQAKKEYEQARDAGRKASLVGQQRSNLFTTSVANIAPGETVTIEIAYLDTVTFDDGAFGLRVPMTLTPRYIPGAPLAARRGSGWSPDTTEVADASLVTPPMVTSSRDHKVTLHAAIDAGMPLDVIASRYHPIRVAAAAEVYTVSLAGDRVPGDHDLELLWRPVESAVPRALRFTETIDGKPHLLLMLMPPDASAAMPEPPPRELILVVDTSGSMHGVSLEQAKQAVLLALDGLRPQDRFNVMQFSSVTETRYPQSVPASAGNLRAAADYVRQLTANGGTEMRPALAAALAGDGGERLRQVVFVTDGAIGNEDALFAFIEQRLGTSRLFTVGIGSAPNGWFMRRAAEAGRGSYVFVSALHEVQEKMARLLSRLEQPQLTDITVQWPAGVRVEAYPARVPDLYSGEPVVLKARLSGPARRGDRVVIRGESVSGGWSAELPLARAREHAGVAALWARARIAERADALRRGGDAEALRAGIVEVALAYRLVSKYTSLVAVEGTPARPASAGLDREQIPNLLPYGQSQQAIFGFPATATVAPRQRLIGLVCVLLATALLWLRVWTLKPRRGARA